MHLDDGSFCFSEPMSCTRAFHFVVNYVTNNIPEKNNPDKIKIGSQRRRVSVEGVVKFSLGFNSKAIAH
jgi:hypothetical protein